MSGGHERKFLEEAGSSFAIPHEEEYFGNLSSADLTTACRDLSLKAFVASWCLARRLEQESKKAKELSVAATTSLQSQVAELEGRLAAEQERNRQLLRVKEDGAKASQAALKTLRLDMENLANAKEDLNAQLRDKDTRLTEAQNETSRLNSVLERYRTEHIQSAEALRSEVLELLGQHNLDAPPTTFPQCTVGAFYEWVSVCFDLITMNTKIFDELGAAVGVRMLAYSVCSLIPVDRPSSEKIVNKSDLRRLTKDDYGWPTDAELDVAQLPVLAKNLAKNFMNTFFAERGSRLTLDESVRLSAQVRRSSFYFCSNTPLLVPTGDDAIMLFLMLVQIGPRLQVRVAVHLRSLHGGVLPQPQFMREGDWIAMPGVPLIVAGSAEVAREAAADVGGNRASAQCDDARVTEEVARPEAEAMCDDSAKGPSDDAERAVVTVDTIVPALTSPGTAAAPEGDAVPAPDENVPAAVSTEENPGGDTSEMVHAAELEVALLAASPPERDAPRSPRPPNRLKLRSSPPKPRSEGP
jgi:hypothetical protein